jgi:NTP pyrophosphatase (non-canonical NTP hydrolase)
MTLKEYQTKALSTAMFPPERGLEYCTLGLVGEVAEFAAAVRSGDSNAVILKELGDCAWYMAILCDMWGIHAICKCEDVDACTMDPAAESITTMFDNAGALANKVKKVIRDGTPLNPEFCLAVSDWMWGAMNTFAKEHGYKLSAVLEANIAKLASRKERGVITGSGDNR